jgi:hypothetical protein
MSARSADGALVRWGCGAHWVPLSRVPDGWASVGILKGGASPIQHPGLLFLGCVWFGFLSAFAFEKAKIQTKQSCFFPGTYRKAAFL